MGCSSSTDASQQPEARSSGGDGSQPRPQPVAPPASSSKPSSGKGKSRGASSGGSLNRPKGYNCAFLQRYSPSGEIWADYIAPAPPVIDKRGKLIGAWADCVYAGVVFEMTNEGWEDMPDFKEGPVGYVINFLKACGYGSFEKDLEAAEERFHEELEKPMQEGSRAFLKQKARNGQTWLKYLKDCKAVKDKAGWVNGAWGECITAAVIFEHENPAWDKLGPYSADGPAGQVLAYLEDCGQGGMVELLNKTEEATHEAVRRKGKLPVFDATYYQPPISVVQAPQVNMPAPQVSGRKKALLIGCNYPGTDAELRGCVNDVQRWAQLLMKLYGFRQNDMVQLTDAGHGNYQFFPTRANMLNAIRWLVDGAQPGDVLFFQFSGHGAQREADDDSEIDGMDELIIPTDYKRAGMIVDHELFDLLVVPLPSGVKLTVILDCCHSGSALDLPFIWNEYQGQWQSEPYPWHTAGDVQMFSGCDDSQCSMDAKTRLGLPAGAMTTAMCDVLEAHAHEPPGQYPQLLGGMTQVLRQRGFEQLPRLSSSQAFDPKQKPFSITDFIVPNTNPQLGQIRRPPPRARREDPFSFFW